MKTKWLAGLLMVAGTVFAGNRVSVGVQFGNGPRSGGYNQGYLPPPPVPPAYGYYPQAPRRGMIWVDGYWYPQGRNWRWQQGYWMRPPQSRARWNAPQYRGGRYYDGYWR